MKVEISDHTEGKLVMFYGSKLSLEDLRKFDEIKDYKYIESWTISPSETTDPINSLSMYMVLKK